MKCPYCGKDLVFDEKTNRYICKATLCECDDGFVKEFGDYESDVSMLLTDNRIYGEIVVAVNIERKEAVFHIRRPGLLLEKGPFVYGPISVNDIDVKQLSYNELAFAFNDPYFAGFIAKGSNRDTTYFLLRLIETLKNTK